MNDFGFVVTAQLTSERYRIVPLMIILVFFLVHWYLSVLMQTVFLHRYAAHQMFTMRQGWEKVF